MKILCSAVARLVACGISPESAGALSVRVCVWSRTHSCSMRMLIIIDHFCIALFSGVHKLTALYNILQHFLSFTNIKHIIMTTNNV